MKLKLLVMMGCLIITFASCADEDLELESGNNELQNIEELLEYYNWLVTESKTYYDNDSGHFRQEIFGYRNVLNECYLPFDGYQLMQNTDI